MIVYSKSVASCAVEKLKSIILVFVLLLVVGAAILWSSLSALIIIGLVAVGWLSMQVSKLLRACTGPRNRY